MSNRYSADQIGLADKAAKTTEIVVVKGNTLITFRGVKEFIDFLEKGKLK